MSTVNPFKLFSKTIHSPSGLATFLKNKSNSALIEVGKNVTKFSSDNNLLMRAITSKERHSILENKMIGWSRLAGDNQLPDYINWGQYVHKNHAKYLVSFTRSFEKAVDYANVSKLPNLNAVIQVHPALVTMDLTPLALYTDHFKNYDICAKRESAVHTEFTSEISADTSEHAKQQQEVVSFSYAHGVDLRQSSDAIINYINILSTGKLLTPYWNPPMITSNTRPKVFTNEDNLGLPISFRVFAISEKEYADLDKRMREKSVLPQGHRPLHINDLNKQVLELAQSLTPRPYTEGMSLSVVRSIPKEYSLGSTNAHDYLSQLIEYTFQQSIHDGCLEQQGPR